MKRYQVYLNQHSVSVLDDFVKPVNMSRSKLIQMIVDSLAHNLTKVFVSTKTPPGKPYILDSLIGSIKLKTKKKTNLAQNIDEIYLSDNL
jgi:hypothetical protein